jgi:hypothetical protein
LSLFVLVLNSYMCLYVFSLISLLIVITVFF